MITPSTFPFFSFCKREKNYIRVKLAKRPFFSPMCGRRLFFSVRARMSPSITAITDSVYSNFLLDKGRKRFL